MSAEAGGNDTTKAVLIVRFEMHAHVAYAK